MHINFATIKTYSQARMRANYKLVSKLVRIERERERGRKRETKREGEYAYINFGRAGSQLRRNSFRSFEINVPCMQRQRAQTTREREKRRGALQERESIASRSLG